MAWRIISRYPGRSPGEKRFHPPFRFGLVVVVLEVAPVGKLDPVKRIDRDDFEVVLGVAPSASEDLIEHERRGNDCRTRVEGEPILPVDVSTPPEHVASLDKID